MTNEITPESLAGAVAYMVSNPDKLSAEQKSALSGLVATPKPVAAQPEQNIEITDTSKGIASSNAQLKAELEEVRKSLKEQKEAAQLVLQSSLQAQEAQYLREMDTQKERNQIISKLYTKMPRTQVDKMVSDKITTDTMKSMYDMISSSNVNLVGVVRGLEIKSSRENLKEQITKLGYSEITFDKGMGE